MNWNTTAPLDQNHPDPADVFRAGMEMHHIANTAYPIGHISTMRPYKIDRSQVQTFTPLPWEGIDRLGLYMHVPFCEVRCGFCEYTVVDPATNASSEDLYFDLLLQEITMYRQALGTNAKTLIGFDVGGGTPSVASTTNIARIVDAARQSFILPADVAISIETTPKIAALDPEKIQAYYDMGIRRISMGVQTISPRLLQELGRTVTSLVYNQGAADSIHKAGFERFNVDVMYGFARQSLDSVEATLKHVIGLNPEYITLYRTRYKGTRIARQAEHVTLEEVNAEGCLAKEILLADGYFATPGKNTFSRLPGDMGTSDYLTERVIYGTPYLGLGLGAQTLSHQSLSYNSGAADKRLDAYRRQVEAGLFPIQDIYHLSREAAMGKFISVAFYFGEIHLPAFEARFGLTLEQAFPAEVDYLQSNGLMKYIPADNGAPLTFRLTEAGIRAYNGVIAQFYAGAVKNHLIELAREQRISGFQIPVFNGRTPVRQPEALD